MGNNQLLVYKASAGSGKTFTLATEYIQLLIKNPRAYREILAVTFTNKATAEMKERILGQLNGIAIQDIHSDGYLRVIKEKTGFDEDLIRERAKEALNFIIHDYNRFRIVTIDSFFQSIIKNLSRELNLGANLNIELNSKEALNDAVDTIIDSLNQKENQAMLNWILNYIKEQIDEAKKWNITKEIKKFGAKIFDETFIEKGDELRIKLKNPENIVQYRRKLDKMLKEQEDTMLKQANRFFEILEQNGLEESDLSFGRTGISSYFLKIANKKLTNDIFNPRAQKCLDDPSNWASKTNKRRKEIVTLASTTLIPLLEETEKMRKKANIIINTCLFSKKHINNLQLLDAIDQELHEENKQKNRFILSDTNALLHHFVTSDDSPFIFEKLGSSINHIMMDEFQDTSRLQWKNFKFLLLNGLSQGYSSLIVGDVKQSIYRWRHSDWRILNSLNDKLEQFPIKSETLSTNRRSAGNIVRFNNLLFKDIISTIQPKDEGLQNAYKDVEQQPFKHPDKGFVQVTFLDSSNTDYIQETCKLLIGTIDSLIKDGAKTKDIAILIRVNKHIPVIAEYFSQYSNYRIVSNEAFELQSSTSIKMLIHALRYLIDSDQRIPRKQLLLDYLEHVKKESVNKHEVLTNEMEELLPERFRNSMVQLRQMPLYDLLQELYSIFEINLIPDEDAYICAFFDKVMNYLKENSSDISSFLNYWDEELCTTKIPSGEIDGIRILSIHSSKGLEFKHVLLPFCDWEQEIKPNQPHEIWVSPNEAPYNDFSILPIDYKKDMAESLYHQDYLEEQKQLYVDNLNLLYVALTRAEQNLFIIGDYNSKKRYKSVSDWIKSSMENLSLSQPDFIHMVSGDQSDDKRIVYETGKVFIDKEDRDEYDSLNKVTKKPTSMPISLHSYKNKIEFKQSNKSHEFITREISKREKYIEQGKLLHYVFSTIHTKKDVDLSISQLRMDGIIASNEQEKEIRELTEKALNQPEVQEWFDGTKELFNECTILYKNNEGELLTKRPDRVMVIGKDAIIVDFKFGQRREEYVHQVQEYKDLMLQMGYLHIKGYLWYVFDQIIEEIK